MAQLSLYHCQFANYEVSEDPVDMFVWAENDFEAKKVLNESVSEDDMLKDNGITADQFNIYSVYAENGGRVTKADVADGQVWFSPNRIAELGLIKDTKGVGNYRLVIRLIKDGKLKANREKGGFLVHRDWIDEYNSSM